MKFSELKKHLGAGTPKACYVVQGEDRYLVVSAAAQFRRLVSFPEFNVSVFTDTASPSAIVASLETMPVMSDLRLVIVEDLKPSGVDLKSYLKNPNPSSVLLLFPKPGTALSRIPENAELIDCSKLPDDLLNIFIKKEANGRISGRAAKLLAAYCSSDLSRITAELEKLRNFAGDKTIEPEDVESMVAEDADYKIYQFTEALAQKNADAAHRILSAMGADAPPTRIIASVSKYYRQLLHIRIGDAGETETAGLLGVKPFVVSKMRRYAVKLGAKRLKELSDYFLDCEYRIKSGLIKDRDAVSNLVQIACE